MSVEALSRVQFATVAIFHFLFVPLTLGLSALVAYMETRYATTGDETYLKMTKYWSRLFLINFAVGVVTGITLEFQFGMNWAEYSKFVGDIFGAPLAIEATVAFFLESTFIGLWMFSWKRVSRGVHAAIMWVVAGASTLSALWILLANGWMQKPRGYVIVAGHAQLTSFGALIWNPYAWIKLFHTSMAAFTLASFFIMGISAIHLLRGRSTEMFKRSFRLGATVGLAASVLIIFAGDLSGRQVAEYQPTKLAAMEAQWSTASSAPFYLLEVPQPKAERNSIEAMAIPNMLSILSYHDPHATVKGLLDFPADQRPPVGIAFWSFRLMVALGFLFVLLALIALVLSWRDRLMNVRWFLWIMVPALALPYVSCELGWILAEFGRQPWIVYGLLRTADAFSRSISAGDVLISLVGFILLYGTLAAVDAFLLVKYARRIEE
ncbi:MAG TPA: cytochrome ubiquinol oxidase subunit I [Rectinemataceae bacterium]|nr:cytochrome ubiquinol oxidase subunit I [Rectinemataceae bacterium]